MLWIDVWMVWRVRTSETVGGLSVSKYVKLALVDGAASSSSRRVSATSRRAAAPPAWDAKGGTTHCAVAESMNVAACIGEKWDALLRRPRTMPGGGLCTARSPNR